MNNILRSGWPWLWSETWFFSRHQLSSLLPSIHKKVPLLSIIFIVPFIWQAYWEWKGLFEGPGTGFAGSFVFVICWCFLIFPMQTVLDVSESLCPVEPLLPKIPRTSFHVLLEKKWAVLLESFPFPCCLQIPRGNDDSWAYVPGKIPVFSSAGVLDRDDHFSP